LQIQTAGIEIQMLQERKGGYFYRGTDKNKSAAFNRALTIF